MFGKGNVLHNMMPYRKVLQWTCFTPLMLWRWRAHSVLGGKEIHLDETYTWLSTSFFPYKKICLLGLSWWLNGIVRYCDQRGYCCVCFLNLCSLTLQCVGVELSGHLGLTCPNIPCTWNASVVATFWLISRFSTWSSLSHIPWRAEAVSWSLSLSRCI